MYILYINYNIIIIFKFIKINIIKIYMSSDNKSELNQFNIAIHNKLNSNYLFNLFNSTFSEPIGKEKMGLFTKKGKQISFNSLFNRLFDEIYLPSAKYEKYDDPSIRNNIEYGSIYNSVCLLMYYLLSIIVEDFQLIIQQLQLKAH